MKRIADDIPLTERAYAINVMNTPYPTYNFLQFGRGLHRAGDRREADLLGSRLDGNVPHRGAGDVRGDSAAGDTRLATARPVQLQLTSLEIMTNLFKGF